MKKMIKENRPFPKIFTKRINPLKTQRRCIIFFFLIFPLLFLCVFGYYPALKLVHMSFTDWDGFRPYYSYIGVENYIAILRDPDTLKTLQNNIAYFIVMLVQTVLALYFAIILDGKLKGRNFFKTVIFMPYILNGVAVAFMFSYLYDYTDGPINVLLHSIGLGDYAIRFLSDSYFINFSLAGIGMWRYTGFAMVIFLGALQTISKDLYEAAYIDGAHFFQTVRYITIPNIKRTIEINLLLGISGALQAFFEPFVITKGGPAGRSETFITWMLKMAFEFQNFGQAAAMSVLLLSIIMGIILIQKKFLKTGGM